MAACWPRRLLAASVPLPARSSGVVGAVGAVAKLFLRQLGMEVLSHVIAVGPAAIDANVEMTFDSLRKLYQRDEVLLNCFDSGSEQRMKAEVDRALKTGDSVGSI